MGLALLAFTPSSVAAITDAFASNTVLWIVVGIAIYWIGLTAIQQRGLLPSYVGTQGPIITLHTKRGRAFLDWLSGPRRFWRAWSNVGVGIALVAMASMFFFLLFSAFSALQTTERTAVQQPRNVVAIPGVNDFLPVSATPEIVFGLLVGLVVHEGGHGLLCRVEDIDIDSMGLVFLAVLPIGAFVEPDEENRRKASRGSQTRMFAAGVTNNFAITLLVFALLFGPVVGAISVAPGAAVGGVLEGSPASSAGISANDRITAVDGQPIETNEDLESILEASDERELAVELNGERETTVRRSVFVTAAVENGPADVGTGDTIVAVDDSEVSTERGFREAIEGNEVITATIERSGSGEQVERTFPVGALAQVTSDGPLATAGAPAGSMLVITEFDGDRTQSYDDLSALLADTEPGQEVVVAGYVDGEREQYEVTLGEHPRDDSGFLGISPTRGVTGLSINDFGIQPYPAEEYLIALGADGDGRLSGVAGSFLAKIGVAVFLPIIGITGILPFNFAGFTGGVQNFYQAQGSLAVLGDGAVFLLANLLFWTGWINVQLGFFNCIPAFPLDGGHILRTSTEAVLSRLPIGATRGMVRAVTTTVGLTMLVSFLLMLFGPGLVTG